MSGKREDGFVRMRTLQFIVLLIVGTILGRLFYIQLVDDRYKDMADNNALRHEVRCAIAMASSSCRAARRTT